MANNKTLFKAIERCEKRIAQARNKKQWAKKPEDKEDAESMIKEQESKILRLRQQMVMNNATRSEKTNSTI